MQHVSFSLLYFCCFLYIRSIFLPTLFSNCCAFPQISLVSQFFSTCHLPSLSHCHSDTKGWVRMHLCSSYFFILFCTIISRTFSRSIDSQFVLWQHFLARRCSERPLNSSVKPAVGCSHPRNCARLMSLLIGAPANVDTWLPRLFIYFVVVWKSNARSRELKGGRTLLLLQPNKEVSVEKSFRLSEEDSAKPKPTETRKVNYLTSCLDFHESRSCSECSWCRAKWFLSWQCQWWLEPTCLLMNNKWRNPVV